MKFTIRDIERFMERRAAEYAQELQQPDLDVSASRIIEARRKELLVVLEWIDHNVDVAAEDLRS